MTQDTKAICALITSGTIFTISQSLVKYLDGYSVYQIIFFRSVFTLFFAFYMARKLKISLVDGPKKLLFLRGFFGSIGMLLGFMNVRYLPLATASTLTYVQPIFIAFLSVLLLKEKIKLLQVPFFILAFVGVGIIQNASSAVDLYGLTIALSHSFFSALAMIMIRMMSNKASPYQILVYFPLVTIPLLMPKIIETWRWDIAGFDFFLISLIGVLVTISQFLLTFAFQNAEASKLSPFKFLNCGVTIAFGVIFFNETFTVGTIIGIILLLFGVYASNQVKSGAWSFQSKKVTQ